MMKTRTAAIAMIVTLVIVFAVACSKSVAVNSNAPKQVYNSTGVIKAIDLNALKVTIDHQDIPGFMSAMEMTFDVADVSLLNGIAAGDKVDFVLERAGGKVALASITKTGNTAAVDGAEVFVSNCAECHGAKGEGKKKGIPLISGHALAHSEVEFIERVTNGKERKMPAFRDKLSGEEIAAVVQYVRTVIQAGLKPDPKLEHKH